MIGRGKLLVSVGKAGIGSLALLALSWCLLASLALGDTATYYYDDLGRLTQVVKGTSGTIYSYDELGNLLSVSSASTSAAAPVLTGINPNVIFVGSMLYVKIAGQNLLTTASVIADNPALVIKNILATDTEISAEMTASAAGPATITVTNAYGSNTIGVTLSSSALKLSPGQLSIVPSSTGTLTASIDPPLTSPLTINLNSSNAAVATAPATATIPAGGTTNITVSGLAEGVTTIRAGETRSVVFVSPPFAGDVSGLDSGRVSVYIEDSTSEPATGKASPVSVIVDAPAAAPSTGTAAPVSVYLEDSSSEPSTTPSSPVSVQIQ